MSNALLEEGWMVEGQTEALNKIYAQVQSWQIAMLFAENFVRQTSDRRPEQLKAVIAYSQQVASTMDFLNEKLFPFHQQTINKLNAAAALKSFDQLTLAVSIKDRCGRSSEATNMLEQEARESLSKTRVICRELAQKMQQRQFTTVKDAAWFEVVSILNSFDSHEVPGVVRKYKQSHGTGWATKLKQALSEEVGL